MACLGLSYKDNIDDLRESPALDIVVGIADGLPDLDIRVAEPFVDALPAALANRPNVKLQHAPATRSRTRTSCCYPGGPRPLPVD